MSVDQKFKPTVKFIDGREVSVTPFPARFALLYQFRLLQLMGQPLIQLLKGPVADLLSRIPWDQLKGNLIEVIAKLGDLSLDQTIGKVDATTFSSLDPEQLTGLMFGMFSSTRIDGRELTEDYINLEFAGNTAILWKIFKLVLEANYRDFLGWMPTIPPTTDGIAKAK
jgi:hypothetical protein